MSRRVDVCVCYDSEAMTYNSDLDVQGVQEPAVVTSVCVCVCVCVCVFTSIGYMIV